MKLSVFKFLFYTGLVLVFLAAFVGCSEDDMESLQDCDNDMENYLDVLNIDPSDINEEKCPFGSATFTNSGKVGYDTKVFSPHNDHEIVFVRTNKISEVETLIELIHFDFCSGKETVLDVSNDFNNQIVQWPKTDWIYFGKTHKYYKVKPSGESLQEVDIPGGIQNLKWNEEGNKVAYRRDLLSGQLIIIADENFTPLDTIDGFKFIGGFDFASNNTMIFSNYSRDEDIIEEGLYKFDFEKGSAELLLSDRESINDIDASEVSDEVFWMTTKGVYKTHTSSGDTELLVESSFSNFHYRLSKSPSLNYIMTNKSVLSHHEDCEYISAGYIAMIDVNSKVVKKLEFE